MGHHYAGLIELSFSGAVAMGIGIWQYVSVSRDIASDRKKRDISPESTGHAVGQHRLDDR
jgi:hypothetical protein